LENTFASFNLIMEFAHPTEIRAKRVRLLAVLSFVVLFIGVAVYFCWPNEPVYHFRTLTSWLEDYANPLGDVHNLQDLQSTAVRSRQLKAHEAVLAIGTNAIPTLLKYAGTRTARTGAANSPPDFDDLSLAVRMTWATDKHGLARAGFMILQGRAAPALPELLQLTHDQDAGVRLFASESILMVAGADPKVIIPMYVQFGHDPDAGNRQQAARFLQTMLLMADDAQKASIYGAFPDLRESSRKSP
jgi:hypothetical protein